MLWTHMVWYQQGTTLDPILHLKWRRRTCRYTLTNFAYSEEELADIGVKGDVPVAARADEATPVALIANVRCCREVIHSH